MRRFYAEAAVAGQGDAWRVTLDDKPAHSPGGRTLVVPTRRLAAAVAAEWSAQPDPIDPASMRLTRLANTAMDRVAPRPAEALDELARYGAADLLCFRADRPPDLAARQTAGWQPLVNWAARRFGARLTVTTGLRPPAQPPAALAALRHAAAEFDAFSLTGLHAATAACGSLVIGLALAYGRIEAGDAWALSQLDELYQAERWGADAEAEERRRALRADIAAAGRFIRLCRRREPGRARRFGSRTGSRTARARSPA